MSSASRRSAQICAMFPKTTISFKQHTTFESERDFLRIGSGRVPYREVFVIVIKIVLKSTIAQASHVVAETVPHVAIKFLKLSLACRLATLTPLLAVPLTWKSHNVS